MYATPTVAEMFTNYSGRRFCRALIAKSVTMFPIRLMGMKTMFLQMMTAFMIPIVIDLMTERWNLDGRHKDEHGDVKEDLTGHDFAFHHWEYWVYVASCMPVNCFMGMVNTYFINSAATSYERRRFLM